MSCISKKNVLESLLGTLLMNDKSKDTNKARQDLEELKIRSELWLSKKGNGKFIKPHPKYSFPPEKRQFFYEFIKGVKLPDGFRSNFKPKVTDNDNNIIGMKSHDCHIMMQRLLSAGAQAYLDSNIATPIIELYSFFKQICARSLIESYMLKAEDQLCGCRKKAGSRNKKLVWYVLDNSPEIEEYKTECCLAMPENDLPTNFSLWFRDKISTLYTKKPSECSLDLFLLASEPKDHATYYTACIVNGVKFKIWDKDVIVDADVVHNSNSSDVALITNLDDLEYTRSDSKDDDSD
ncbi:hypothetical protein Tco_1499822 [Tanacetum coccineum]